MSDFNDSDQLYGKYQGWTYRVLSKLWTCPDDRECGRRFLSICRVYWKEFPVQYPIHDDVETIHDDCRGQAGHTIEEVETDLERRRLALDEPVLIRSEWETLIPRRVSLVARDDRP